MVHKSTLMQSGGGGSTPYTSITSVPSDTILGNNTGSTANAIALTPAQVNTMLGTSGGPFLPLAGGTMSGGIQNITDGTHTVSIANGTSGLYSVNSSNGAIVWFDNNGNAITGYAGTGNSAGYFEDGTAQFLATFGVNAGIFTSTGEAAYLQDSSGNIIDIANTNQAIATSGGFGLYTANLSDTVNGGAFYGADGTTTTILNNGTAGGYFSNSNGDVVRLSYESNFNAVNAIAGSNSNSIAGLFTDSTSGYIAALGSNGGPAGYFQDPGAVHSVKIADGTSGINVQGQAIFDTPTSGFTGVLLNGVNTSTALVAGIFTNDNMALPVYTEIAGYDNSGTHNSGLPYGGLFQDGTNTVYIADGGTNAITANGIIQSNNNGVVDFNATITSTTSAAEFDDNSNQVILADGTNAITASGNVQLSSGDIVDNSSSSGAISIDPNGRFLYAGSGGKVIDYSNSGYLGLSSLEFDSGQSAYFFNNVTIGATLIAGNGNPPYVATLANAAGPYAGQFVDGTNTTTLADGTFAVNATGTSYFFNNSQGYDITSYLTDGYYGIELYTNATNSSPPGFSAGLYSSDATGNKAILTDGTYAINAYGTNNFTDQYGGTVNTGGSAQALYVQSGAGVGTFAGADSSSNTIFRFLSTDIGSGVSPRMLIGAVTDNGYSAIQAFNDIGNVQMALSGSDTLGTGFELSNTNFGGGWYIGLDSGANFNPTPGAFIWNSFGNATYMSINPTGGILIPDRSGNFPTDDGASTLLVNNSTGSGYAINVTSGPVNFANTVSAPSLNTFSLPPDVYGTSSALLASPDAWGEIYYGGTAYRIPLYL